jgi:pimeloyl-ACP methyl ester carboxylesterase
VSTFCLVHGAWHGGWCWERLVPELEGLGHAVVTLDLPSEDTTADFDAYADVVVAALDGVDDDVVLVGHSLGGLTIPRVAARREIRHLVFLCALIPAPGLSLDDHLGQEPDMLTPLLRSAIAVEDGLSSMRDEETAIAALYDRCEPEDASWAYARLHKQARFPQTKPFELDAVPDVERTYIVASDDRAVAPEWSRRAAPERLGVRPVEMEGDHSPFLARPAELARLLTGLR